MFRVNKKLLSEVAEYARVTDGGNNSCAFLGEVNIYRIIVGRMVN